ncbi:glycosyltransferase family 4 protein [Nocardioides jejuensis]|uniref:Glycosyltransferase family 1 protein n=1 Tax=Nocardioides jejuensis TaxID=2502782 RepID=A0A4R1CKE2_9ACTN|nr:glycosyltransferase family 4 protein [Nocardioides jejuensis]TCJ30885.1 glycosyltransferase family 1 protein [Nocardioides jejuensis]
MSTVLQVSHYYPPHIGGLERVVFEVAHGLQERGHDVEVLTSALGASPGTIDEGGVRVHRMRALNPFERFAVPFPLFLPSFLVAAWKAIGRADVVQIHDMLYISSWVAALFCRIRRTPYVVTCHVGIVDHPSRLVLAVQRIVHRTLGQLVLSGAAQLHPITEIIEQQLRTAAPSTRTVLLPNGVDQEFFRPAVPGERAEIRARYGLPADEPLVLFVGRPVPKKGHHIVAAAGGDGFRLVFVGVDGPNEPGGPIHLGSRSVDEVAEIYRAADVFICASVGEAPLTVQEAMSSGITAIINDDPFLRALDLTAGARYIAMSPEALRAAITDVLAQDTAALGAAARAEIAGHHSRAAQVERLEALLAEAVAGPEVLRVALLTPRYVPHTGGVEKYVEQLAVAFRDAPDVEVLVVTTHRGWRRRTETVDGVEVIRLPAPLQLGETLLNPWWALALPRLFRRRQVDVVNAHSPGPGLAETASFRSGDVPVVMTYHSGSMVKGDDAPPWMNVLLRSWERWVLPRAFRRSAALIACSTTSLAHDTGRATVIPPSVDTSAFLPGSWPRPLTITYVGRIEAASRWKGLQVLVDALPLVAQRVAGVRLEMVGDGDDVAVLGEQATRLGVADLIDWRGALPHDAVARHLASTTVAVLPSLTDAEAFGTVIVEAMACGTPVVGSTVGGIPGNISDGVNGFLVSPGDPQALADALVRILEDPDLARRLGEQAREVAVSRFDLAARNEATQTVLRAAAGRGA